MMPLNIFSPGIIFVDLKLRFAAFAHDAALFFFTVFAHDAAEYFLTWNYFLLI
jgi:hypothetical protein